MYFHVTALTVECRLLRVFNTLRNIIHLKSVTSPQLSATTPTLHSHRLLGSQLFFFLDKENTLFQVYIHFQNLIYTKHSLKKKQHRKQLYWL